MKNFYPPRTFFAVMMLVESVSAVWAAPRSVEQAKQIALEQMTKDRAAYSKGNGKTSVLEPKLVYAKDKAVGNVPYYYVFSAGKGLGYTIVSGDDRMPAVVGYTASGDYDTGSLPSNFVSFMQAYQDFVDNATDEQMSEAMAVKAHTTGRSSVMPFMGEKWNQSSPYNNMCPTYQGQSTYTGCVATAVAQILHYHSQSADIRLKKAIPAYTTKKLGIHMQAIAAGQTYDWANMQYIYNGDETAVQNDAVAKLMLHVGCAVQMDYAPDASGANATAGTFVDYFGMDPELTRELNRENYNISEWDDILYGELADNRPVYYTGQSTGGGHAFVIHGYADGLYYVNWGWGGYCDGYFDVTVLNPNSSSGAGASSTDDGYSMQNRMIVGIQPDNGIVDDVNTPVFTTYDFGNNRITGLSKNGSTVTFNATMFVANINSEENTRYVSLGYKDGNGKIVPLGQSQLWSVTIRGMNGTSYGYLYSTRQFTLSVASAGTYELFLIESKDGSSWTACNGCNKTAVIKVDNNSAILVSVTPELTATAQLGAGSGGYVWKDNTIDITVDNTGGKEYYGIVYIMVSNSGVMPGGYTFAQGITAPAGGSTTFSFSYIPKVVGVCNFWILDANGREIGKSSITFLSETPSGIGSVVSDSLDGSGSQVIYNLNGQRMNAPRRGISIINGRKVIVK